MTIEAAPPRAATVVKNLQFWAALVSRQLQASFALRGAFWMSALLMLVNSLIFFSTWWILLARFDNIGGWRLPDIMCLYGLSAGGYGLCVVLCGGLHDLSRRIEDGDLDVLLTQPKSVLLQALASRTTPSGWGDLAVGVGLLALSGRAQLQALPALLVGLTCAGVTYLACGVVMHSLAFWLGRTHTLSRALWEFTLMFSLYPPVLFGTGLRFVLYTLLPAGLISYLPVELLRAPSLATLAAALGGTAAYAAFALWLFARGLRRYASGNRFNVRA
jgi:ABC-2 type transport system permease protein